MVTAEDPFCLVQQSAFPPRPPGPPAAPAAGTARWKPCFQLEWCSERWYRGRHPLGGKESRLGFAGRPRRCTTWWRGVAKFCARPLGLQLGTGMGALCQMSMWTRGLQMGCKPAAPMRGRRSARIMPLHAGVEAYRQWPEGGWSSSLSQVRWVWACCWPPAGLPASGSSAGGYLRAPTTSSTAEGAIGASNTPTATPVPRSRMA